MFVRFVHNKVLVLPSQHLDMLIDSLQITECKSIGGSQIRKQHVLVLAKMGLKHCRKKEKQDCVVKACI